jgi:small subunit ribosomal protein S4
MINILRKENMLQDSMEMLQKEVPESEYAVQLKEKQKAKYTYGILERQFYKNI